MRKTVTRRGLLVIFLIVLSTLFSCGLEERETGSLQINVNNSVVKTILPEILMLCTEYTVSGIGADLSTFGPIEVVAGSAYIEGLSEQLYQVTAIGKNVDGIEIGVGTASADVTLGVTTNINIVVTEIEGIGNLVSTISWSPNILVNPSVVAKLVNVNNDVFPLIYDVNNTLQQAQYPINPPDLGEFPNGFYAFIFQMNDSSNPVGGFADILRIVTGEETLAIVELGVNPIFGSIDVTVSSEILEELILGSNVEEGVIKLYNDTVPYSISISGGLLYQWFLNGVDLENLTNSFLLNPQDYEVGDFSRLDVIAWNGEAAGSLSFNIIRVDMGIDQLNITGTTSHSAIVTQAIHIEIYEDMILVYEQVIYPVDGSGSYAINNIAEGTYTLKAWIDINEDEVMNVGDYFSEWTEEIVIPHNTGLVYNFSSWVVLE